MSKKTKLFSAAEEAEAVSQALDYFKCSENELYLTTLTEGNPLKDWLIFAVFINGDVSFDADSINAEFDLLFETDGVYFELYPAGKNGMKIVNDNVTSYIRRKGIESLDTDAVMNTLSAGFGRVKIAPPQEEVLLDEDIAVSFSKDNLEANIVFLPPDDGGEAITINKITDKAREAGVLHGLSILGIRTALKEKSYGPAYPIAKATMPVNGVDGTLTYHFNTERKTIRPNEDESGHVDFRNLDLFERVKEGQLLMSRTLATAGTPGLTVTGDEIKAVPGKEANFPRTNNVVINEDKTEAYSQLNGYVKLSNGTVTVSDVYTVAGDCDLSVGNIDFDGNVVITGAVISGMVIKATGNVTVGGVVNDAEIIAGGNINLKLGIQGMGKGALTSGGSIVASFIERADVKASETVTADVILHSNVEAGHSLVLNGKRGNMMGGKACVGNVVTAKTIGGPSHVQTEIDVGIVPEKVARLKFLKEKLAGLDEGEKKIQQLEAYLSKAATITDDKRASIIKSIEDTRAQNAELSRNYSDEYNKLQYDADHATDGKVHCTVMAYPGMRLSIGSANYKVIEQTQAATFKYNDGSIVFIPCEVRL